MIRPSPYLLLPFSFDVARLREDLAAVETSGWISHFNTGAYEKNWGCIPLRSVGGIAGHIMPVEGGDFQDTPILARCPYFSEVIDSFPCEKTSIRLMSLESGGVIKEHRDEAASIDDGMTRLHIPVQTSKRVTFRIDGEEVHFTAGGTW
ncbi:MAG: aspartyl/asparaginyl beta-hydroxylase domain-containing protein, partial [Ramlibacter sp.]